MISVPLCFVIREAFMMEKELDQKVRRPQVLVPALKKNFIDFIFLYRETSIHSTYLHIH